MTDPSLKQAQPEHQPDATDNGQVTYTDSFIRRRVAVTGTGGVAVTVVVVAQRGQVWVSIQPLFTWDAIMEPGKVDELMRILALAQEDAKRMAVVRGKGGVRGREAVVREITSRTVTPSNKTVGTRKARP